MDFILNLIFHPSNEPAAHEVHMVRKTLGHLEQIHCIGVLEWYFVTKIVLTYCEKKNSSDGEKLLKFEAEGQEFSKFLRSLEQLIQTVRTVRTVFW